MEGHQNTYKLGLNSVWEQVFYKNKNIIYTAYQNPELKQLKEPSSIPP